MTIEAEFTAQWRALALAVLEQAVQDAVRPNACKSKKIAEEVRQDALDFLFGEERTGDRVFWCEAAGLNPKTFAEKATEIVAAKIDLAVFKDSERKRLSVVVDDDGDDSITIH